MKHKIKTLTALSLLALLLAALVAPAVAEPIVIKVDPFTDGQCVAGLASLCEPGDVAFPVVQGLNILDGERDILLTLVDTPVASVRTAGEGRLDYANGPGTHSLALLAWDGPDGTEQTIDYTGLGDWNLEELCDLSSEGWRMMFEQYYLDQSVEYQITIYTDLENYSEWSSGPIRGENYGQSGARSFSLGSEDFVPGGDGNEGPAAGSRSLQSLGSATDAGGADYARIGAITLFIDAALDSAVDLTLGDIHFECEPAPTAVDLVSFDAQRTMDGVLLTWETAVEIDLLGFNLYRAEAVDGTRIKLNDTLIPSLNPGSPVGNLYEFLDATVTAQSDYHYWLEDVDADGTSTFSGPVFAPGSGAVPGPATAPALAPARGLQPPPGYND